MKPMLAHRFADHRAKLQFPCYVQPKLNGVRCIYNDGSFQSRDGHLWNPGILEHIKIALSHVPPHIILDGELYVHGWPLQRINGAASVNRVEPSKDTYFVEYHIFDYLNIESIDLPFTTRASNLLPIIAGNSNPLTRLPSKSIKYVPTHFVASPAEADQYFSFYKQAAYEGLMYRDATAPYGLASACTNKQNRWATLLKRKDWLDDWFTILDAREGTGKYSGLVGSLVFDARECQPSKFTHPEPNYFTAGSGLSDLQRKSFMDRPPIGKRAHIRYEMLSESGIPLKPTLIEIEE